MSSIVCQFEAFETIPKSLWQNIKHFHISKGIDSSSYVLLFVVRDNHSDHVYGAGDNSFGQLGQGHNIAIECSPIEQLNNQGITQFHVGYNFVFGLNHKGHVYGWGRNKSATLGIGYTSDWNQYLRPTKIDALDDIHIVHIECGFKHCLGLSSDGVVYGWGDNSEGQVGCGHDNELVCSPVVVELDRSVKYIHCFQNRSFAVTTDGQVFIWGEQILLNENVFIPRLFNISAIDKVISSPGTTYFLDSRGVVMYFKENSSTANYLPDHLGDRKYQDFCIDNKLILQTYDECVYDWFETKPIKTPFKNLAQRYIYHGHSTNGTLTIEDDTCISLISIGVDGGKKLIKEKLFIELAKNEEMDNYDQMGIISAKQNGTILEVKSKLDDNSYAIKKILLKARTDVRKASLKYGLIESLKSEFLVNYHDAWINLLDKSLYIRMELCEHGDLVNVIDKKPEVFGRDRNQSIDSLEYFASYHLFKELTECLHYLHSQSPPIIDRDLRPSKVLITDGRSGRFLKLSDFGCDITHDMTTHSRTTDKYSAPEVFLEWKYCLKSDVYSLAIIAKQVFGLDNYCQTNCENLYPSDELETYLKNVNQVLIQMTEHDKYRRLSCEQVLASFESFYLDKSKVLQQFNSIDDEDKTRLMRSQFFYTFLLCKLAEPVPPRHTDSPHSLMETAAGIWQKIYGTFD